VPSQISLIEKTQIQRDSFQTHRNSFRIQRNGFHPDPLGRDLGEGANHLTRLDDPQGRRNIPGKSLRSIFWGSLGRPIGEGLSGPRESTATRRQGSCFTICGHFGSSSVSRPNPQPAQSARSNGSRQKEPSWSPKKRMPWQRAKPTRGNWKQNKPRSKNHG
jgi:hypothetical protein